MGAMLVPSRIIVIDLKLHVQQVIVLGKGTAFLTMLVFVLREAQTSIARVALEMDLDMFVARSEWSVPIHTAWIAMAME